MHKYIEGKDYWKEGNTLKFKIVYKYKRVCKI